MMVNQWFWGQPIFRTYFLLPIAIYRTPGSCYMFMENITGHIMAVVTGWGSWLRFPSISRWQSWAIPRLIFRKPIEIIDHMIRLWDDETYHMAQHGFSFHSQVMGLYRITSILAMRFSLLIHHPFWGTIGGSLQLSWCQYGSPLGRVQLAVRPTWGPGRLAAEATWCLFKELLGASYSIAKS